MERRFLPHRTQRLGATALILVALVAFAFDLVKLARGGRRMVSTNSSSRARALRGDDEVFGLSLATCVVSRDVCDAIAVLHPCDLHERSPCFASPREAWFFDASSISVGEDNSWASRLLGRDRDDAVETKLPRKGRWVRSPNCREDLISSHGLGGMLLDFGAQELFGRESYAEADSVGDCVRGLAADSGYCTCCNSVQTIAAEGFGDSDFSVVDDLGMRDKTHAVERVALEDASSGLDSAEQAGDALEMRLIGFHCQFSATEILVFCDYFSATATL